MTLDRAQFYDTFFEDSFEALDSMEAALLQLSTGDVDAELINTIFRVAHSIKGGSATFGFTNVAAFTHTLETLLDQLRAGKRQVSPGLVDVLLRSCDLLREMLGATRDRKSQDKGRVSALHSEIEAIVKTAGGAPVAAPAPAPRPNTAVVSEPGRAGWRIHFAPGAQLLRNGNDPLRLLRELVTLGPSTVRVNAKLVPPLADLDAEECRLSWNIDLAGAIPEARIRAIFDWVEGECELAIEAFGPLATPGASVVAAPAAGSIRVSIEKIDELLNSVGELVITQSALSQLAAPIEGRDAEELRSALGQLERHMHALHESVMRVRMLPISFVFNRFPRLVRDLGQRLGKKIELRVVGDRTELDKTVLEKIGDPLVHLMRNSIDHGIESPEMRLAAGKSAHGVIGLSAYLEGGNVMVEVSDDGGGLKREKILAKARERGLVGADEELSEDRILSLVFAPGFSTADFVSDVSGRGVGMDVVRRNINELGGHVQLHSTPGKGSTVRICLPCSPAAERARSLGSVTGR